MNTSLNSFFQTLAFYVAVAGLFYTVLSNKARESTAMDALFHKYDAIEKYVDTLHAALYKPQANGAAATDRTVAARAANLCDMATGMPLGPTPAPTPAALAAAAAAAAAAGVRLAVPAQEPDIPEAKRAVNAWLEDVCYHTKGVGARETFAQAFKRKFFSFFSCCGLGRSRDALQVR